MSQASPHTTAEPKFEVTRLPEYHWYESGQSVLSGSLLELYRRIDNMFLRWAGDYQANEFFFPIFISARELAKLDYFRSFPHLVTFPASLDPAQDNLKRFTEGNPLDEDGCVHLTALDPVRNVLTPAACYHFYVLFQGQPQQEARYLTTRATCFRRETHYLPLERQWNFSMREIVCIGSSDEVKAFLTLSGQSGRILQEHPSPGGMDERHRSFL
jgi:seryl-tRNA synthetase